MIHWLENPLVFDSLLFSSTTALESPPKPTSTSAGAAYRDEAKGTLRPPQTVFVGEVGSFREEEASAPTLQRSWISPHTPASSFSPESVSGFHQ